MGTSEEFNRLYGGAGCSVQNTDWNSPRYFDKSSDCYASEIALMESLTSEAYNKFGYECEYYIVDRRTNIDEIYGEDSEPNVVRRFRIKMYSENVPTLQRNYGIQGMQYNEVIVGECSISDFTQRSTIDYVSNQEEWEEYNPRIGDIIYFKFSDMYYEILNVKKMGEGSVFLGEGITYQFHMRVWKNTHDNVDRDNINDDSMDNLRSYEKLGQVFNMEMYSSSGDEFSINNNIVDPIEDQVMYKKGK